MQMNNPVQSWDIVEILGTGFLREQQRKIGLIDSSLKEPRKIVQKFFEKYPHRRRKQWGDQIPDNITAIETPGKIFPFGKYDFGKRKRNK